MDFRDQFRKMSDDVGKMAREVADTSKRRLPVQEYAA